MEFKYSPTQDFISKQDDKCSGLRLRKFKKKQINIVSEARTELASAVSPVGRFLTDFKDKSRNLLTKIVDIDEESLDGNSLDMDLLSESSFLPSSDKRYVDLTDEEWLQSATIEERWKEENAKDRRESFCTKVVKFLSTDVFFALYTSFSWHGSKINNEVILADAIEKYHSAVGATNKSIDIKSVEEDFDKLLLKSSQFLTTIQSRPSFTAIRMLGYTLGKVFRRLFSRIQVEMGMLEALRNSLEASNPNTPIILLPTHKSHMDYLILSYVQFGFGLPVPHIAAGDNLNIPLVGSIFRYSGSFFIKRKIGDNNLYKSTLKSYLTHLLQSGACVEFFIEGGRSRSGKVNAPKLGLLGTIMDAVVSGDINDALIVPISVDYECIPEGRGYAAMSLGQPKVRESLMGVVKNARKFLSKIHGDMFIHYGRPLSFKSLIHSARNNRSMISTIIDNKDTSPSSICSPMSNSLLSSIGSTIGEAISSTSMVTSTSIFAVSLLNTACNASDWDEWIPISDLAQTINLCLNFLHTIQSSSFSHFDLTITHDGTDEILRKCRKLYKHCLDVGGNGWGTSFELRINRSLQIKITELGMYRNTMAHIMLPYAVAARVNSSSSPQKVKSFLVEYLSSELPCHNLSLMVEQTLKDQSFDSANEYSTFLLNFLNPFLEGHLVFYESLVSYIKLKNSYKLNKRDLVSYFLKFGAEKFRKRLVLCGENLTLDTSVNALTALEKLDGLVYYDKGTVICLRGRYGTTKKLKKIIQSFQSLIYSLDMPLRKHSNVEI